MSERPATGQNVREETYCAFCPQGKMYGKKHIAPFVDDIIAMYLAGKNDKSKRMGPPGMLKALARKYSDRLDLPAENEIRQAISKLMAQ
jgi:hypothetical protein